MSKTDRTEGGDASMKAEYDFSRGARGRYANRVGEGANVVILAPDVAAEFKDSTAVNRVLRAYLKDRQKKTGGE